MQVPKILEHLAVPHGTRGTRPETNVNIANVLLVWRVEVNLMAKLSGEVTSNWEPQSRSRMGRADCRARGMILSSLA